MILLAFSVFDAAAEAYMAPTFMQTKGQAIRSFADAVNEEGHSFARHAADYTLFHVGMFDESTGMLKPLDIPDSMGNALTFVTRPDIGGSSEAALA